MRAKSLASLALSLTLIACGGGGDDDPDAPVGPGPDADPTQPDAAPTLPDATTTIDASGADAFPTAANAASLGQVCGGTVACPEGYLCLVTMAMATNGFCSLACVGDLDSTCQNGFPGPGQAMC